MAKYYPDDGYPLPTGLEPLPPIMNCRVKAVEEDNTDHVYYYDSLREAAQDLKIYARMIHHALDKPNQSLYSKKLDMRLMFYKVDASVKDKIHAKMEKDRQTMSDSD